MEHKCHAHGCGRLAPPRMLACRPHWFALRKQLRNAIWCEYRTGQEERKDPTLRYLAVQQLAVAELAFKPNDEDAARAAAPYVLNAERYRRAAIDAGMGDPLAGLCENVRKGARITTAS